MAEFASEAEQARSVFGTRNDPAPVELAAERVALNLKEPDLGITAGSRALAKEM